MQKVPLPDGPLSFAYVMKLMQTDGEINNLLVALMSSGATHTEIEAKIREHFGDRQSQTQQLALLQQGPKFAITKRGESKRAARRLSVAEKHERRRRIDGTRLTKLFFPQKRRRVGQKGSEQLTITDGQVVATGAPCHLDPLSDHIDSRCHMCDSAHMHRCVTYIYIYIYVCICICICGFRLLSLSLSLPLYILGDTHRDTNFVYRMFENRCWWSDALFLWGRRHRRMPTEPPGAC